MSDGEFENYLTLIGRLLRLSPAQREAIGEELRDHFESRLAELLDRGLAHDEAVRIAIEEFGDAAGLAASFSSISQTRRRRLIMRCTVASVAAMAAAVVVATAVWPEHNAGRVINNAVAQTAEKPKTPPPERKKTIEELTAQTQNRLNELTKLEFIETPLIEGLTYMSDAHHFQFHIHKRSLEDAGLDPKQIPISFALQDIRLKTALDWILGEHNLGYVNRDGVILIATKDWLDSQLETRVYDCRSILAGTTVLEPQKPRADPPSTFSSPEPTRTSAVERKYLHLAQASAFAPRPKAVPVTSAEKLTALIRTSIAPGSWDESGGHGSIVEYQGLLVVNQTAEVQNQIGDLLHELTEMLAVPSPKASPQSPKATLLK